MENGFKNKVFLIALTILILLLCVGIYETNKSAVAFCIGLICLGLLVGFALINIAFGIYNQFIKK